MSSSKIIGLSAALAALGAYAVMTPSQAAARGAQGPVASDAASEAPELRLPVGPDLMNFIVGEDADGMIVADHSSHASHASHASHSSHHSGV